MRTLRQGWRFQTRVVGALMIRELHTRFGRENIGFLWMMVEPLLFAVLVGLIWRLMRGPEEHGVGIISFVVTGYMPLVMFRNSVNRMVDLFQANSSLMYHRQIKLLDFVLVRFLVEMIGHMMGYVFIICVLVAFGVFPVPYHLGYLIAGWCLYSLFTFACCTVLAPLAVMSDVVEKIMPVTVYVMIPFSGAFAMLSWTTPAIQTVLQWSPPVDATEMMRFGVYGYDVDAYINATVPLGVSLVLLVPGLILCRRVRRQMVVE